jgi:hypothetical protein
MICLPMTEEMEVMDYSTEEAELKKPSTDQVDFNGNQGSDTALSSIRLPHL